MSTLEQSTVATWQVPCNDAERRNNSMILEIRCLSNNSLEVYFSLYKVMFFIVILIENFACIYKNVANFMIHE